MAGILRGDIVWANLDPSFGNGQKGKRPVVVLSENIFNEKSGTIIAMAITSQEPRAGFPLTLQLSSKKMPKKSWVKTSQIRTLSAKRIGKKISKASSQEIDQLLEGLIEILGA